MWTFRDMHSTGLFNFNIKRITMVIAVIPTHIQAIFDNCPMNIKYFALCINASTHAYAVNKIQ